MRERDRAIARQGPGRRRPDDDGRRIALHRKRHENRVAHMILVFHLRLGQRGLFHHRPHHRLGAAIQQPVRREFHDLGGDPRLGLEGHGRIGTLPLSRDAETLELLALHREPLLGIGAALPAEGDHRGGIGKIRFFEPLGAVILLLDLPFDRQAVAIPARHIGAVLAQHPLAAGHNVLEDFIQRVADVNIAIGVGRPVVQHEFRAPGGGLAQLLGQSDFLPAREEFWAPAGAGPRASENPSRADRVSPNSRPASWGSRSSVKPSYCRARRWPSGACLEGRARRRRGGAKTRTPRERLAASAGRASNSYGGVELHPQALAGRD